MDTTAPRNMSSRKAIISYYTAGQRGLDGLTDRERALLLQLQQLGRELSGEISKTAV